MIKIYTSPSCSSCRKVKKWFKDQNIPFEEKSIFSPSLSSKDLNEMLAKSENGTDDIISSRSKIIKEKHVNIDDMKISELLDFVKANPSVLKRPIIVDNKRMQVGYNEEEIRVFIPRRLRDLIMTMSFSEGENGEYEEALQAYVEEIKSKKAE